MYSTTRDVECGADSADCRREIYLTTLGIEHGTQFVKLKSVVGRVKMHFLDLHAAFIL